MNDDEISFYQLFSGWNRESLGNIPDHYDVIPRDMYLSVQDWYQIIKTFDSIIKVDNSWFIPIIFSVRFCEYTTND